MPHAPASLSPRPRPAERLFAALQLCLPTRWLSSCVHRLAQSRIGWLKRALINGFDWLYAIDLGEAAEPDRAAYPSFNAYFTRALRPGTRPVADDANAVIAPVDGQLGAFGAISAGRVFQTKGMTYGLQNLLAGSRWAERFEGGSYATLYLAPRNYHRVHMPVTGVLRESHYVPGRLFGVNPASVRSIPRLFTRNERLIAFFDTDYGPMAIVMVGAFCVGGIETTWAGRVCPPHRRGKTTPVQQSAGNGAMPRGVEMGRFNLGSSVILLFGPNAVAWHTGLVAGQPLVLGRSIGRC